MHDVSLMYCLFCLLLSGCITKDPDVDVSSFIASTTKSKTDHYFSDKEKKEQLEKLLKSKNKTDLQVKSKKFCIISDFYAWLSWSVKFFG